MTRPTQRDQVKSDEEFSMVNWLMEAEQNNLVVNWEYEPRSFVLFNKRTYCEIVQLKTKQREVIRHLHAEAVYTPDFHIALSETGARALYSVFKTAILTGTPDSIWVDIKSVFNPNDQPRYFSVMQKIMFDKHGIWSQKIIPFYTSKKKRRGLFVDTFAPECDRWKKNRIELNVCGISCKNVIEFIDEVSVKVEQPTLFNQGDNQNATN